MFKNYVSGINFLVKLGALQKMISSTYIFQRFWLDLK